MSGVHLHIRVHAAGQCSCLVVSYESTHQHTRVTSVGHCSPDVAQQWVGNTTLSLNLLQLGSLLYGNVTGSTKQTDSSRLEGLR
jgi:hypothetical protein